MKLQLAHNIFWPFATVSLLLLLLGIVGAWHVHQLQQRTSEVLAFNVASIRAAEELEIVFRETRTSLNNYLLTNDTAALEQIPEFSAEAGVWLTEAERLAITEREQVLVGEIRRGYEQFQRELALVGSDSDHEPSTEAVRHLSADVLPNQILAHAREYLDVNEQQLLQSSNENQQLASRLVVGLLILGICGAMAGGIAGYMLAMAVRKLIVQLNVPIRDVQGKLNEVTEPISISANTGIDGLDTVLHTISARVTMVVEELQQTQRDVLRSEQLAAVGQLAAGLAHELRNPLMAMKMLVQSACDDSEEGTLTSTDLHVLEEEIGRLERLVQMFLDFARPPRLQQHAFDLCKTVYGVMHLLEPRATRRGIHVVFHAPRQSVTIEADESQLRQVLLNLVINAMDAVHHDGRIEIQLQWTTDCSGSQWATLTISDNGCGLPVELGNRIFEPFVSTKETGVGLGLSICRRIVESHGGTINGSSECNRGSVFVVQLPKNSPCTPIPGVSGPLQLQLVDTQVVRM